MNLPVLSCCLYHREKQVCKLWFGLSIISVCVRVWGNLVQDVMLTTVAKTEKGEFSHMSRGACKHMGLS